MNFRALICDADRWARLLGWASVAGIVCGVSGPFGSYSANMFSRSAYWIGLFWAGCGLLWCSLAAGIELGGRLRLSRPLAAALAVFVGCIPLALLAAAGCKLFWPVRASWVPALQWYGQCLFVGVPAAALGYWLEVRRSSSSGHGNDTSAAPAASDAGQTVWDLPVHLVERATCLQMEDHHVRVHGVGRSTLHLMPLRQAIAAVGEDRGMQVHRSWWVAHGAVREIEPNGRSVALRLHCGLRVPVSRYRLGVLRAAGFLALPER